MHEGNILRIFERQGLMPALCIGHSGKRLRLLCPDGREMLLAEDRIVHASADAVDITAPQESLTALLREQKARQEELSRRVDPASLWSAAGRPGQSCDMCALARAAFGGGATALHEAAVIAALVADQVYFRLQGRSFLAHTAEQVERQKRKKQEKIERERFIGRGIVWLQAARAGQAVSLEDGAAYIELLKDYAALGRESQTWSRSRGILHGAGIKDQRQCFDLLVRLGIFEPDENLLLRRYGIPQEWPPDVLEQVRAIGAAEICAAVNDPGRRDLTQQYACAIDESFTRDVDDAISFRFDGDVLELGVHITDVAAFVGAATPLDREAERRGASLYLPETKIPMLPPALSEYIASFRVGERSPALSFIARISGGGDVLDFRIVRSVVRIAERLTYAEADGAIAAGSAMTRLHRFALALREKRLRAGGMNFLLPEMQVRVDRSHGITLKLRDRETPGQLLVAECMILANYCAARYIQDNGQPGLFRRQAEPAGRLPLAGNACLFDLFRQRRMLRRVDISTAPGPHSSLGLGAYASITSPLRKYLDLVMQRQLVSLLQGDAAAYTRRELSDIMLGLQPVLTRSAVVEHERWRYWIIKAMLHESTNRLEALVLEKNHGCYELLLPRFMLSVSIKAQDAGDLAPGSTVAVAVDAVNPFAGSVTLRVIEQETQG